MKYVAQATPLSKTKFTNTIIFKEDFSGSIGSWDLSYVRYKGSDLTIRSAFKPDNQPGTFKCKRT